jgi:fluoroacetyl-CoA thioesterase
MDYTKLIGSKGYTELVVQEKDTASAYGSGGVDVFATPAMVAIMENAAVRSIDNHLPKGMTTVGTHIDVKHLAATPIGMKVRAEAELIEVNGKKLKFKVEAFDEKGVIGEGSHNRYIIDLEKFMGLARDKKE